MRKVFFAAAIVALAMSSCSTISNTASTETVDTELYNRTTADLSVSEKRVSYTFTPTKSHERGGLKSMRAAAVSELLKANGNADVLINPRFEIKKTNYVFFSKVKYIVVSGQPAFYKNYRPMDKKEAEIIYTLGDSSK